VYARFAAPLIAALLLVGCTGVPAPVEDHDSLDPQRPDAAVTPQGKPSLPDTDWTGLSNDLESALREVTGGRVDHLVEGLRISLPAAHGFTTGKTHIMPAFAETLQRTVPILNRYQNTRLHIVAHTDSAGSEMFNLRLSIQRAEAVMEHLRRQGVALARMSADGRGETEPIANNAKPDGRARNRRIEIFLTPG
jgi:outer membrane protein OmpA-like peptidoglycan-associated protein